jgi:hypothetical protein
MLDKRLHGKYIDDNLVIEPKVDTASHAAFDEFKLEASFSKSTRHEASHLRC